MWEKIAQVGVMGAAALTIVGLFVFLTVISVLDAPGFKEFDNSQLIATVVTLTAGLGGAIVAAIGGKQSDG